MFFALLLSGDPPVEAMRLVVAWHAAFAGVGMLLLGGRLGFSRAGSLVAATLFVANPMMFLLARGFINTYATFTWAPWLALLVHWGMNASRPTPVLLVGSLAAAGAWFAGYPQFWFYNAIAVALLSIAFRPAAAGKWQRLWFAPAMFALGLCLSAFQVLPFLDLWHGSNRSVPMRLDLGVHPSLLPWIAVPSLGDHRILADARTGIHLGFMGTVLALFALARLDRLRAMAGTMALMGLWLMSGQHGGAAQLLHELPLFPLLRGAPKFFLFAILGISLLAGAGLSDVQRRPSRWHLVALAAAMLGAGAVLFTARREAEAAGVDTSLVPFLLTIGGTLVFMVLLTWCVQRRTLQSTAASWLGAAGMVSTLLGGAVEAWHSTRPLDGEPLFDAKPPDEATAALEAVARDSWLAEDGWRTHWGRSALGKRLPWDPRLAMAGYWRAEMTSGYSAMLDPFYGYAIGYSASGAPLRGAVRRLLAGRDKTLDVLSTRYVIIDPPRSGEPARNPGDLTVLNDTASLLVSNSALPRVRFVEQVVRVASREEAIATLQTNQHSPENVALVDAALAGGGNADTGQRQTCTAVTRRLGPGSIDVATSCPGPGFAVLAERWAHGWTATIDGRPAPLERVYGLILGLDVPAGESRVSLRYRPPGFDAGVAVSWATLALIASAGVASLAKARRAGPSQVDGTGQ